MALDKISTGPDLFLEDIIEIFEGKNENEKPEKEVEFKVFLDGEEDRDKVLEFHNQLQNKLISDLGGESIFDGNIEDTRYYDTKNKDFSILKEENISMVRIRKQNSNSKEEYIYTVKKIDENNENIEYEKGVEEDFGKIELEEKYGLQEIKRSSKNRKEIKFEVYVNGKKEEVKIAFDEYTDKVNKGIPPFFEVEGKTQEIADKGYEKIKKLFPELNFIDTTGGPKKYNQELERKKIIENLKINEGNLIDNIAFSISLLLEDETIFTIVDDVKNNSDIKDKNIKKAFKKIKLLAFNEIKKEIKRNSDYKKYFNRIIETDKDGNISMGKKFNDKFEREFSGYYKAFINSLSKSLKGKSKEEIVGIIRRKLNLFLKTIFMFDDSLNKDELEMFLDKPNDKIQEFYDGYFSNITKLTTYSGNIQPLLSLYSRAHSTLAFENNSKNNDDLERNKEIVSKNIEKIIKELFTYLSQSFSVFINSQKTNKENREIFETIKGLFLDVYRFIYILKNEKISFGDKSYPKNCDHYFFQAINNEYNKELFNEENFILEKNGPKIFKKFLWHISESDDYSFYKGEYNKINEEEIKILLEKNNKENKRVEEGKITSNEINFKLWSNLTSDSRLKIFLNKVLINRNGKFTLNKKVVKDFGSTKGKKYSEEFSNIEYKKKFKTKVIPKEAKEFKNEEDFIKYKETFINYETEIKRYIKYKKDLKFQFSNIKRTEYSNLENFISNDINGIHLLVSWFQFNLKKDYSNNYGGSVEKLELHSQSFTEQVITKLSEKNKLKINKSGELENNLGYEFIPTTSKSYNSSEWGGKSIKTFFNRICNLKSINLDTSYYFDSGVETKFMKNYKKFYIPEGDDKSIENIYYYIENNIEVIRKIYNDDNISEIEKSKLIKFLNEINFPIENKILLKKLMEFLKFIYKEVLLVLDKSNKKKNNNTNKFAIDLFEKFSKKRSGDLYIAPPKEAYRTVEKCVQKHGGRNEKVGDVTRATILVNDFQDMVDQVSTFLVNESDNKNIISIRLDDKVGNMFKKSKRANGYRDSKLMITFKDGTTGELQFQFKDYYKLKHDKINLTKNLENKIKKEVNFDEDEIVLINNHCKNIGLEIPKDFSDLFNLDNYEESKKFNADFTYNISRSISNENIKNKVNELDRIIFDYANSQVALKELKRVM